jgi:hypothetical protein
LAQKNAERTVEEARPVCVGEKRRQEIDQIFIWSMRHSYTFPLIGRPEASNVDHSDDDQSFLEGQLRR